MNDDRLARLLAAAEDAAHKAAAAPEALAAQARICSAMYRYADITGDTDSVCSWSARADSVFRRTERMAREDMPVRQRARLLSAMWELAREAAFTPDAWKTDACCDATASLLGTYGGGIRPEDHPAVCRCVTDLFYPVADAGHEWMRALRQAVEAWADSMDAHGRWSGTDCVTALERIEVMSRNSYMFLDDRFDDRIARALAHYAAHCTKLLAADTTYGTECAATPAPAGKSVPTAGATDMTAGQIMPSETYAATPAPADKGTTAADTYTPTDAKAHKAARFICDTAAGTKTENNGIPENMVGGARNNGTLPADSCDTTFRADGAMHAACRLSNAETYPAAQSAKPLDSISAIRRQLELAEALYAATAEGIALRADTDAAEAAARVACSTALDPALLATDPATTLRAAATALHAATSRLLRSARPSVRRSA